MHPLQREILGTPGGAIPFERFMAFALADPQHGYYARRVQSVGRDGDFSTSVTLSGVLATAIGRWARNAGFLRLGRRAHVIELGGGTGELAHALLAALGWWHCLTIRYHIVELSPALRRQQQKRLRPGSPVTWHETIESALAAAGGRAVILSNEFVDAFPCAALQGPAGARSEVYLEWPAGLEAPREVLRRPRLEVLETRSSALALPRPRVEVHASYQGWLATVATRLSAGALLTIDYGGEAEELYHRQPMGSVRGFFRHTRVTGAEIYERIGHQDLTADVNFTDLKRWGEELGWRTESCVTQREFVERFHHRLDHGDPATAFLLDPEGAGSAFRVLDQRISS